MNTLGPITNIMGAMLVFSVLLAALVAAQTERPRTIRLEWKRTWWQVYGPGFVSMLAFLVVVSLFIGATLWLATVAYEAERCERRCYPYQSELVNGACECAKGGRHGPE